MRRREFMALPYGGSSAGRRSDARYTGDVRRRSVGR